MSRRRREKKGAEVFGTSLADILTTALGCVLLLFLLAVMHNEPVAPNRWSTVPGSDFT